MAASLLQSGSSHLLGVRKIQEEAVTWQLSSDFVSPLTSFRNFPASGSDWQPDSERWLAGRLRICHVSASMAAEQGGDATSARERRKMRQARRVELAESKKEVVIDSDELLLASRKRRTMKTEEVKSLADLEKRGPQWYILTIGSSGEKTILEDIEKGLQLNYPGLPFELFFPTVPSRTVTSRGKLSTSIVKLIPNTIYIRIQLSRDLYDYFRSLPRIIGFYGRRVGRGNGVMVIPAASLDEDVERLRQRVTDEHKSFEEFKRKFEEEKSEKELQEKEERSRLSVGSKIRVINGPFKNSIGQVQEVSEDQKKVKVLVSVFDQPAVVKLTIDQIELMKK